jgi:hypothetical protein
VILLLILGVAARVVLRRPWIVQASVRGGPRYTRQVTGWNNAKREIADLATQISNGTAPLLNTSAPGATLSGNQLRG